MMPRDITNLDITNLDRAEFSAMSVQAEALQEEGLTLHESWAQANADVDGDFILDLVDKFYYLFIELSF